MYHGLGEAEPMLGGKPHANGGNAGVRSMRLDTPSPKCNDLFFAILFYMHVGVILSLAVWKGIPTVLNADKSSWSDKNEKGFTMVFTLGVGLVVFSILLSALWMQVLMKYASSMIRVALWMNVGMTVLIAITSAAVNPLMTLLFLVLAAINVCYIYYVQNRIGFATANLQAACAAVSTHSSVFVVAFIVLLKQFGWLVVWSLGAIGVFQLFKEADPENCNDISFDNFSSDPSSTQLCGGTGAGIALFFMLVSIYWGQQVLQNVLTCTISGVVATWWYQPPSHNQKVTTGALYRSMTTSFGSICLGSLIVAILHALRTMARLLREKAQDDRNAALACVACLAECVLSCVEGIMEYFNQWAFVYVGIYGYDFRTSGKAVMDLFANRGWTAVINDDLTSSALTFGALGVGCVACGIALVAVLLSPDEWFSALGSKNAGYATLGALGFIAGISMAMLLANVVITALHTVFVCFAEDPIAFSRNHPKEYHELVNGWREFHGDALVSAYGTAV